MKIFIYCILVTWYIGGIEKSFGVDSKSVVGRWECRDFSKDLLAKLGLKEQVVSSLKIDADGFFSASNFPVRSPYKLINLNGGWKIISGEMTPSGKDSIYLGSYFLSGGKKNGVECLVYVVSGKDDLKIFYHRPKSP